VDVRVVSSDVVRGDRIATCLYAYFFWLLSCTVVALTFLCNVWVCVCVGVLLICVHVFTVFCIVCTVFFVLFRLCICILT
jgi:hypothetical protein